MASRHDPARFVCGVRGTAKEHQKRMARTHGACGFVGMWHTHPDMRPVQSHTDIAGMATLVAGAGQNQRRALMLIFGRERGAPTAGLYVYESHDHADRIEAITADAGMLRLSASVV